MPNEDAWKLDSGLREDMVLSIHSAYFSPHADYQGGNAFLLFLIGTDENDEPVETRMSVGGDWTSSDGGKTITHPTKTRINKSTIYGHWIQHSLEIPELAKTLMERGAPTTAAIWEGLILHLQIQEISFGRNLDPQQRLMPTEYMGEVDSQPQLTVVPPTTTVAPAAPAPATDPQAILAAARAKAAAANNTSPLHATMLALAGSSPDFATFVTAAFENPDVLADDELAVQVADENGIWAAAH